MTETENVQSRGDIVAVLKGLLRAGATPTNLRHPTCDRLWSMLPTHLQSSGLPRPILLGYVLREAVIRKALNARSDAAKAFIRGAGDLLGVDLGPTEDTTPIDATNELGLPQTDIGSGKRKDRAAGRRGVTRRTVDNDINNGRYAGTLYDAILDLLEDVIAVAQLNEDLLEQYRMTKAKGPDKIDKLIAQIRRLGNDVQIIELELDQEIEVIEQNYSWSTRAKLFRRALEGRRSIRDPLYSLAVLSMALLLISPGLLYAVPVTIGRLNSNDPLVRWALFVIDLPSPVLWIIVLAVLALIVSGIESKYKTSGLSIVRSSLLLVIVVTSVAYSLARFSILLLLV